MYSYLTSHNLAKVMPLTERLGSNAVPEAQPGDLIAYQWSNADPKHIPFVPDHFAVVVDIAPGDYPEVSEWGVKGTFDLAASYQKRGWTWSEEHHQWLQAANPTMQVKLLQVGR